MVEPRNLTEVWAALDPHSASRFVWLREPPGGGPAAILMGAFDPPTVAHVAVLAEAAQATGLPGAFCLTKVLLDRPDDRLLPPEERLELLDRIASREQFGLAVANRGTYLEVAREAPSGSVFVVGSDKLAQIRDPAFYPDGEEGVRATEREVPLYVMERGAISQVSASEVRRRLRRAKSVEELVPPEVGTWLRRYTEAPDATRG